MKKEVFISYSRKDTAIAEKVCNALDKAGISYFIDRQGIGGGMEFPAVLARAILDTEIFLFLGSVNSYDSKFTNAEVTFAFNKKNRNRIVPYLIDNTPMPIELEFTFSAINWRTMETHPVENLADDLLSLLGKSRHALQQSGPATPSQKRATMEELYVEACQLYANQQYNEAFELLARGAEGGHLKSMKKLALCYEYGKGTAKNPAKKLELYRQGATHGDHECMYWAGMQYYYGEGTATDLIQAVSYLQRADKLGNLNACLTLGDIYYEGGNGVAQDLQKAFDYYKKAANAGNAWRQWKLARMYEQGEGTKQNLQLALQWYRESASQGFDQAHYSLGEMYLSGKGVKKDDTKAIEQFRAAAAHGHQKAIDILKTL